MITLKILGCGSSLGVPIIGCSCEVCISDSPYNKRLKSSLLFSYLDKDILVDFRILNASYKDYYTVSNHIPRRVFQWKNFDGLKSDVSEAYTFDYTDGTMGMVKDILVKKATLIQPSKDVDMYKYNPVLKESDEIVYRFFYHPDQGKYMTQKKNTK